MKRELFRRVFARQSDTVKGPMIAADHLAFLLEKPLHEVCRSGDLLAEGFLRARRRYGSDFIILFADVSVEAEALGVKLEYFPDSNPQPVRHLEAGQLHIVDMPSEGRLPELFTAAQLCRRSLGDAVPLFFSMKDPFSLAALTLGADRFLEQLITAPASAEDILEICCLNQQNLLKAIVSEGYIPFIGAPLASGGLIGKKNFRRFAYPYLQRLFDEAKQLGSFSCLHLCGEIGMLTDALVDLKLNLLSFEDWHQEMWDVMPDTIPMGFIATDLFLYADQSTVRKAARACKAVLPSPHVLSTACDLPARAKPELVEAMMTA